MSCRLVQCIGEAFGVDPSNQAQVDRLSVKPATLQSIFDVYIKTVDKVGANEPSTSKPKAASAVDKVAAEKFKAAGNASMSAKKYDEAIKAYSEAIDIDPTNAIYYSNRAAAYSSSGDHLSAVGDAEKSISVDSSFVKAYHRLGYVTVEQLEIPQLTSRLVMHNTAWVTLKLLQMRLAVAWNWNHRTRGSRPVWTIQRRGSSTMMM